MKEIYQKLGNAGVCLDFEQEVHISNQDIFHLIVKLIVFNNVFGYFCSSLTAKCFSFFLHYEMGFLFTCLFDCMFVCFIIIITIN